MELNILSNGLILELNEKDVVIEATVIKVVSRIVIVRNEFDTPFLLQVKVKKSIIVLTRNEVNVVISTNMEVLVSGFD
jgi:hypothetical protein